MEKKILLMMLFLLCAAVQMQGKQWEGSGTKSNPWLIKTADDLNYIATRVNSGKRTYKGKYFRVVADINYEHTSAWNDYNSTEDNFTPIGTDDNRFYGYFNGRGHTISGIRVYRNAESLGLFGNLGEGGYVHDLILTDTRITGTNDVGGIAGYKGKGTIRNCIVSPTVAICSYGNNNGSNHGGIVGGQRFGKIDNCTSSATLVYKSGNGGNCYGAIVGSNGGAMLTNNLAIGAVVPAADGNSYGAICGTYDDPACLEFNYYHGCTVAGVVNATGVGSHAADVTRSSGAKFMDFEGDGSEAKPYIIRSQVRWKIFAYYVNNGETLAGKYVKLTKDLTVPTMVGNSEAHSFQGIFDGGGHTLTIDYKSSTPGAAPFSYVKDATIKNLNVAGTITTSAQYAGGIVGQSYGSLNLTDCRSSITIDSSVSGDGSHGGLVGILNGSNNTISGCVFNGSFATTNGTTNCGGFVGSAGSNAVTIEYSLISPVSVAEGMLNRPFVRGGNPTITKCYYHGVYNLDSYQGTEAINVPDAPTNLGNLVADNGLVKVYNNGLFYDGNYYITPVNINGDGTEGNPYIIDNADKWNTFACYVTTGKDTYNGKFVKLDADITVSAMAGSSENNSFQGTFLGNGHTLTFNRGTAENLFNEECCAPFRYTKSATIQNLKVAGDIYTSEPGAAGFISRTYGRTNIRDSRSSIIIHSTYSKYISSGSVVQAGFVAQPEKTAGGSQQTLLNIDGCVYDGLMVTTLDFVRLCSGFVGLNKDLSVNISNSLYAPNLLASTERKISEHCYTFVVASDNVTVTGCYYTVKEYDGGEGGLPALAAVPDNSICKKITVAGTTVYSPTACTVSGIGTSYLLSEGASITPTIKNADETLVFGTDYTATLDGTAVTAFPVTISTGGLHTLSITGKGDYQGTENYTILVDETTLTGGTYTVSEDLAGDQRITISGDVVVNLAEGVTVHAKKGIELPEGSSLTINGPGKLVIDDCDANKSGIGAASMGTLTINGGQLTVKGGTGAAGIGSDTGAASGTLTIDYTNTTDYLDCSSYAVANVNFAEGKRFVIDDTKEVATAGNIGGKKVVPCPLGSAPNYPFTIGTAAEWDDFVAKVNSGATSGYKDQFVKLTADIEVTTMAGSDASHVFRGTFDGDGHTLTINYTTNERFCGPFRYTFGATIKNLKTAGTITTSNINAGGVVGRNGTESTTLENVSSNVTINSTVSGAAYHGGLMGYAINAAFKDCIFTGKLLGAESHHIGGLLGQKSLTDETNVSFVNCLFAPTEVNVHQGMSYPFAAGAQQLATVGNDCYYAKPMGGTQGVQVYSAAVEGEINKQVTAIDGNTYYMLCTVSGVKVYKYNGGNDITVEAPTVTAADGTVLTNSDFTYTPTTVSTEGRKDLIVSGSKAPYSGSKSLPFYVGSYPEITSETTTLSTGEYKVYTDVTIPERITISGDVTLILGAGATLTATKGIELGKGNSLTINGETDDTGKLDISGCDDGKSGIGAVEAGVLTVNGGTIAVVGGRQAAAIGGDYQNTSVGTITINGGQVTASAGGPDAAGIGMGAQPAESDAMVSGTLTLGWTRTTDYIYSSGYTNNIGSKLSSISFADGKTFVAESEDAVATADNIGGQKIVPAIVLADKGSSNSDVLYEYEDKQIAVILNDRTLYADGKWNTICLPFDLSISEFDGVEARTLTAASISGTTLNLTFGEPVKTIIAGTPYIIKYNKDINVEDNVDENLVNPVFSGVTINTTENDYENNGPGDTRVQFLGIYNAITFTDFGANSVLLLGGDNKLHYAGAGAGIGACRAFFKIGNGEALARQITSFNIDYGDGTTGLVELKDGKMEEWKSFDAWYTLDGHRLQGKPVQRGVYINNGKKFVIK